MKKKIENKTLQTPLRKKKSKTNSYYNSYYKLNKKKRETLKG
jgi:hypothetical protein